MVWGFKQPARAICGTAMAVALSLAVATGCGSSSDSSGGSGASGGSPPKPISITFVEATPAMSAPQVALAENLGYFKQVGLKVKHLFVGANIATVVASGQGQIGNLGGAGIIQIAKGGKPTTAIWGSLGNAIAGMLVARSGIKSVDDLKALPSCKLAGLTPGTSNYGWVAHFKTELGLDNCKIVQYNSDDAEASSCATGRSDACGGIADLWGKFVAAGKANILIDSRKEADRQKYIGTPFTDVMYWGLSSWIKSHPEAVKRFVKAMHLVDQAMQSKTTDELAAALAKDPNYKTFTPDQIKEGLDESHVYWNTPDHGYVSKSNWDTGVKNYAGWGIQGFDPNGPDASYSARVDMSYYDQVVGKPGS